MFTFLTIVLIGVAVSSYWWSNWTFLHVQTKLFRRSIVAHRVHAGFTDNSIVVIRRPVFYDDWQEPYIYNGQRHVKLLSEGSPKVWKVIAGKPVRFP